MIVCSLPRCGATSFCLDLQDQTGLKFVGELHPVHIGNDRKSECHETGFQTNFDSSTFAELLHNNDDHIVLINQHSYLLLPQSSFIMLRRNMRNAAFSLANFLIKMYPNIKPIQICHQITLMYQDWIAIKAYIDKYPKDVIWYEDYYGITETNTPLLDVYRGRDVVIKEIDKYYGTHV